MGDVLGLDGRGRNMSFKLMSLWQYSDGTIGLGTCSRYCDNVVAGSGQGGFTFYDYNKLCFSAGWIECGLCASRHGFSIQGTRLGSVSLYQTGRPTIDMVIAGGPGNDTPQLQETA